MISNMTSQRKPNLSPMDIGDEAYEYAKWLIPDPITRRAESK